MNSVGFTPQSKDHELEKLREAWLSLNALLKRITNAEANLQNYGLRATADHLKVAKWNLGEVKKAIKVVGQSKNQRASTQPALSLTDTP